MMLSAYSSEVCSELTRKLSRALDVGEYEGDGAARELGLRLTHSVMVSERGSACNEWDERWTALATMSWLPSASRSRRRSTFHSAALLFAPIPVTVADPMRRALG
jgi:hypothetical protein